MAAPRLALTPPRSRRLVELSAERERLEHDLASLEAQPPTDVRPEAIESALISVPDLRDELVHYGPAELAQLFEDFDIEVEYDKHQRRLRIAATLDLDPSPETARPPRRRSHNCDIAGARYGPISDRSIAVESCVEWQA